MFCTTIYQRLYQPGHSFRYHTMIYLAVIEWYNHFQLQHLTSMILIGILVALTILLWYSIIRPLNYFNRVGVKQTNPWPIIGDQWRLIFGRMTSNDVALWMYNLYPKTRYVVVCSPIRNFLNYNIGIITI